MALGLATAAAAALPPDALLRARQDARHHVLLRVTAVKVEPRACRIEGQVERAFRGGLAVGAPVQFAVACLTPDVQPAPGPTVWREPKAIRAARFMEGFFDGAGPALQPAGGQVVVVPGARETPRCSDRSLACDLEPAG